MAHVGWADGGIAPPLDRISEVYKGEIWSSRLAGIARKRIEWICGRVAGRRVLDIGCSQGIVSILLARAGFDVVGIDIEQAAIDYAMADQAREPAAIREKISFLRADIADYADAEGFDTIVLGEVLEHQTTPVTMVGQAIRHLKVGGRLVVTSPFGFHPHDDHRSILFPSSFLLFGNLGLENVDLEIHNNYLFASFNKVSEGNVDVRIPLRKIIRLTEAGTINSQKRLHRIIADKNLDASDSYELSTTTDGSDSEIKTLKKLEKALRDASVNRERVQAAKNHFNYRLGQTIARSVSNVGSAIRFPADLYKLVREELGRGKTKAKPGAVADNAILQLTEKKPTEIFLKKDPVWARSLVVPGKRYRLTGTINSGRDENAKGALLRVRFQDEKSKRISLENDILSWDMTEQYAYCYIGSGRYLSFAIDLDAPQSSAELHLGFQRSSETQPIYAEFVLTEFGDQSAPPLYINVTSGGDKSGLSSEFESDDRPRPTVAAIFDEFTHDCLAPNLRLLSVTKSNWEKEIRSEDLLAFMAESTWQGNGGEWKFAMTKPEKWGGELQNILQWCSVNQVPSVFWNKEDPVNFDVFKSTATKFDHVFTTDVGSIASYKALTGHANVHLLRFAAQPLIHNPIKSEAPIARFAFTGSWRGVKYPERAKWLDTLLMPIIDRGLLDIYDRYADETKNPDLIFPNRFKPALRGGMPYEQLVRDVYRRYMAFVNVNSVEASETMLARRVFEMLACGAPVISSPSPAMESTFADVVITARTSGEVADAVDRICNEPLYRERLGVRGVRLVHGNHTYGHRLEQISEAIGKPMIFRKRRKVSILCCSKRPDFLDHLSKQIKAQTYEDREIVFVAHSPDYREDVIRAAFGETEQVKVLRLSGEKFLADGLNLAMRVADGDVFAKFDDDDYYGPNYLYDSMLAFDYAPRAGVVGKQSFFSYIQSSDKTAIRFPGKSYCYCKRVQGGTLVWARQKTEGIDFTSVRQGTDSLFLQSCADQDVPIFSIDPFNFIHVRYADASRHTWKISDEEFESNAYAIGDGIRFDSAYV